MLPRVVAAAHQVVQGNAKIVSNSNDSFYAGRALSFFQVTNSAFAYTYNIAELLLPYVVRFSEFF